MPLLADKRPRYTPVDCYDEGVDTKSTDSEPNFVWRRRFYILLAFSISIILLVVGAVAYRLSRLTCPSLTPGAEMPYSPAPLKYVNKYFTGDPDTPKFMGQPRPELDQAWHDLLTGTLIRYTREELLQAGNATSVKHKDGGYKRLKQYLHPDYYYSHEDQNWDELYSHVDHCLESIRQELLCNADVNVYTLKWTPHSRFKPTVKVPQPHACVDWKALHGWMQGRASRLEDMVGPPESLYEGKGP
ncbi:hypothetical protein F4820DRAFT_451454 [Hypoxylon rubiginosum]|uniref:Uncharacterized protein n=1 Tax=Hypoxylon rubiginosum TaxID=110542 RepID=A0ACB9YRS9_9PEZI|nr:hypothetical protein F4820DRAFT_451454 [Hypoxylon rubiginosum]